MSVPIRAIVAAAVVALLVVGWVVPPCAAGVTAAPGDTAPPVTPPQAREASSTSPATQRVAKAAPPAGAQAVLIPLAGTVDDYNCEALKRNFDKARKLGAKVVILRVDTYGGLVTSGLEISRFLKNQNDLYTIAFVDSKAISAGAMIALACDEIVMMPSATLGDCAPIQVSETGEVKTMGEEERGKAVSPILPDFEESARRNGYDPLLAKAMVRMPVVVHWVEDADGRRRFVEETEYKTLTAGGEWKPVAGAKDPVDAADTLLTVHTDDAIRYGLARDRATSAQALAESRGYSIVADLSPSLGDTIVAFLSHPLMRMLLMVIFLQSLFIALHTPGHGAAEAVCLLAFGLLVGVPLLTGYAEWWEIVLIFAGLALIAFEIFVFPGHLVSLIVGVVLVLGGLLMTFVGDLWSVPGGWRMPAMWDGLERGIYVIVGGLFCSVLLAVWLRRFLPRLPYANRLILSTVSGGQVEHPGPLDLPAGDAADRRTSSTAATTDEYADAWPFVGTVGRAVSDLKPGGSAEFPYADDTRVTAVVSDSGYVRAGTKLAVREVRGNRVVVRAVS